MRLHFDRKPRSAPVFAAFALAAAAALFVPPHATAREMANETFQSRTTAPSCSARVSIVEAVRISTNIRVGFSWQTTGATSVTATVRLFPHGSSTPVYTSGPITVTPASGGTQYFLITPSQPLPSGLYRVRVNLATNCIASAQAETFLVY